MKLKTILNELQSGYISTIVEDKVDIILRNDMGNDYDKVSQLIKKIDNIIDTNSKFVDYNINQLDSYFPINSPGEWWKYVKSYMDNINEFMKSSNMYFTRMNSLIDDLTKYYNKYKG